MKFITTERNLGVECSFKDC